MNVSIKHFSSWLKIIFFAFFAVAVAACGGGGSGTPTTTSPSSSSGSSSGGSSSGGGTQTTEADFNSGLLENGGFKAGDSSWKGNHGTLDVKDEGLADALNNILYINVETVATNPWDVNLEQAVNLVKDKSYKLSFKAKSATSRTIHTGIGQNGGAFANTKQESIALTSAWKDYEYTLIASFDTTTDGARAFFEFGDVAGDVSLDNISLVEVTSSGTPTGVIALPVTYEDSSVDYAFTDFDGGVAKVIANPQSNTNNNSAKVGEMVKNAGETFGGSFLTLGSNIDFAQGKVFTMKVWASRQVPVLLKFESGTGVVNAEVSQVHTGASDWETLSFDFTGKTDNLQDVKKVVLIFDNGANGDYANTPNDWKFYFDDITQTTGSGGGGGSATAPTDAPAAPTAAATDVISIYSDTYTNITGVNTNPDWMQTTVTTEETIASNKVLKLAGLNYQGTDWAGNVQNVSCLKNLHVSYWTADAATLKVYVVGGSGEAAHELTATKGSWQNVTIPLTTYNTVGLYDVKQFKFEGTGTVYLDNLYFSNDAGAGTSCPAKPADPAPTDAPTAPTAAAADVISLYSDAYTDVASNTTPKWSEVVTDETHAGNDVKKTTNFLPFQLTSPIDITQHTTLHVDVWLSELPSAGAGLLIKVLDAANGNEAHYTHPMASLTTGQWNSIDIPLSSLTQVNGTWDATARGRVDQVLVDIVDDATMFVDNVYFKE